MNTIALVLMLSAAPVFEAKTLTGNTLEGSLVELTANQLSLQTDQGLVTLETGILLGLSQKVKNSPTPKNNLYVEFIDGTIVCGQQYTTHDAQAKITLFDGQTIEVPVQDISSVRLQRESEALVAEWSRLTGQKRESDLLVILKDEVLDYHKGVLHNVDEEMVHFDIDGDVLPVKRVKVYGLAYHHSTRKDLPSAICHITDASGSHWAAKEVAFKDKLQWTTPTGVTLSMPLEMVLQMDFSSGKISFLSDLQPESVQWNPFFGGGKSPAAVEQFYAPQRDRNFDAATLQLGGVSYAKGLAIHSRTELAYRVPDGFNRFLAMAGIDDNVKPSGKVRLVIQGDAKVLFDSVISGSEPPKSLDLEIGGVHRLVILVDFAGVNNVGDHLLLGNARIMK